MNKENVSPKDKPESPEQPQDDRETLLSLCVWDCPECKEPMVRSGVELRCPICGFRGSVL